MTNLSRWFAPAVLAAGLGLGAMSPVPVHAQDALTRVLVDVADVVFNQGVPYYRYGNDGYNDRLIVVRDRYGRPVYYRRVPASNYYGNNYYGNQGYDRFGGRIYDRYGRAMYDGRGHRIHYRSGPPYGNAWGHDRNRGRHHGRDDHDHDRHDRDHRRDHDWHGDDDD